VMASDQVADLISRAAACLHTAEQAWNAVDPSACEHSCAALLMAVSELDSLCQVVKSTASTPQPASLSQLRDLSAAAARMSRLLDSAAAFWQGMALRVGWVAQADASNGSMVFAGEDPRWA